MDAAPALGMNLDGDGDLDVLIGSFDGAARCSSATSAVRRRPRLPPAASIRLAWSGQFAASPELVDIDGDGDLDLRRRRRAQVYFFRNTGSARPRRFRASRRPLWPIGHCDFVARVHRHRWRRRPRCVRRRAVRRYLLLPATPAAPAPTFAGHRAMSSGSPTSPSAPRRSSPTSTAMATFDALVGNFSGNTILFRAEPLPIPQTPADLDQHGTATGTATRTAGATATRTPHRRDLDSGARRRGRQKTVRRAKRRRTRTATAGGDLLRLRRGRPRRRPRRRQRPNCTNTPTDTPTPTDTDRDGGSHSTPASAITRPPPLRHPDRHAYAHGDRDADRNPTDTPTRPRRTANEGTPTGRRRRRQPGLATARQTDTSRHPTATAADTATRRPPYHRPRRATGHRRKHPPTCRSHADRTPTEHVRGFTSAPPRLQDHGAATATPSLATAPLRLRPRRRACRWRDASRNAGGGAARARRRQPDCEAGVDGDRHADQDFYGNSPCGAACGH